MTALIEELIVRRPGSQFPLGATAQEGKSRDEPGPEPHYAQEIRSQQRTKPGVSEGRQDDGSRACGFGRR